MRTFRCIYGNCCQRLRFPAEVSTKLHEMHLFRQFKDHKLGKKYETRQITTFFSSSFSTLFVTFILVFKNSQNSFSCGLPFGPFWSVKYLNFGQKLPLRTAHHTFIKRSHPGFTKNLHYILSTKGSQ